MPSPNKGPDPLFTQRINVKVRPDQRQSISRLATALGMTESDIVRWILDHGITALTEAEQEHTR